MNKILDKVSMSISGLMLGSIETGNLLVSYGVIFKIIFGIISGAILFLLILKIFSDHEFILEELKNPAIAGVASTFPMGIIILSSYIIFFSEKIAYATWIIGFVLQCVLIIYFTKKFIFNFDIKKVFPSYFVVYVGVAVSSIVAPVFNSAYVGKELFWFGFIAYLVLLPIICYRIFFIRKIPEALIPTITILAAPASLCLTGYLCSFETVDTHILWILFIMSFAMFLAVILHMPKMLKLKFYPSYSAFTFPLVISAIAMQSLNTFLTKNGIYIILIQYLSYFTELIAIILVVYVLICYLNFLFIEKDNYSSG